MKLFKTSPTKIASLVASVAIFGFASQSALALTASGTAINNTASLTYAVAGTPQTPIASSPTGNSAPGTPGTVTSFVVDNKVDFTVVGGSVVTVQPNQIPVTTAPLPTNTNTVMAFSIVNNGNTAQGFNLLPTSATTGTASTAPVGTDIFDPTAYQMFVAPAGTLPGAPFNPATAVAAGSAGSITSLAPGATAVVYVLATIPATTGPGAAGAQLINGNQSVITLTATATAAVAGPIAVTTAAAPLVASTATAGQNATGGAAVGLVDVVFAEAANPAVVGAATPILANNGSAAANGVYTILVPSLVVTKTASIVCDPISGSAATGNIPGAVIQYAITVANTAAAGQPAVNLNAANAIFDNLVPQLAFDPTKIQGGVAPAALCATPGAGNANGVYYVTGAGTAPAPAAAQTALPLATAVTAAAAVAPATGTNVNINPAGALPAPVGGLVGDLPAGNFITVYFNAVVL